MIESNLSVLQKVFSIKDSFRWLKQQKKKKNSLYNQKESILSLVMTIIPSSANDLKCWQLESASNLQDSRLKNMLCLCSMKNFFFTSRKHNH